MCLWALFNRSDVVVTPHLGASTGEAQLNVAISVAEQIRDFLLHGTITSAVNVPAVTPEQAETQSPYLRLAEKMASLHAQLRGSAPREVRIELCGEAGEADSRPITAAVLKGLLASVLEVPVNAVSAPILAKERGIKVATVIIITVVLSAFAVGAAVNAVCRALGVAFT